MKTLRLHFLLIFSFCFVLNMNAQIPDGTTAPGWTATDLDGNTWDMYTILNSGKHVVLEFSATWCGPCWNFHQTGTMENLHDTYGPDGTDQIRVFYIEADLNTNTACLYNLPGCNSSTQGDWVTGHDFPFIDLAAGNASGMANDYQIGYYPTIYAVSANGNNGVFEVGQETSLSVWASWFFESFEMEVSASITDATCPGEGAIQLTTLNGAGTVDYMWSNGAPNADNIDGLEPGTYSVTATDDNGYAIVETFEVGGPADGPIQLELLASSDVLCFGENSGAINVGGSGGNGGYSFLWNTGFTGSYADGLPAGVYAITVTDQEGCTAEDIYEIDQPNLLTLTSLPEDANCGAEDGGVVSFATGGSGPWSYDYGNGPNFTGTFEDVAPGDYVMTVTDDNGCVETSPFTINSTEGPMVSASVDDGLDCSVLEVIVSGEGSSEGDNIDYTWSTEDGNILEGATDLNATVDAAGTYTLTVLDNDTGCSETMDVTVEENVEAPAVAIEAPETLDCDTENTVLDGSGSTDGDNITYLWTSEDGNITSGANTNMAEVDAAGTYKLLITNTDNGCTDEMTVAVELDDALPTVEVEDKVLDCTTTEVELCADVDPSTTVTWTTQDGEVEANCITVDMAGTFLAVARGSNGCESSAEAVVSLSADLPQVSIEQPETITCTVETVSIDADLEGEVDDFEITWMNEGGDIINTTSLSIDVSDAGTYTLMVVNPTNGCSATSSVVVDEVIINPESGFTTNLNDGVLELTNNSTGEPFDFSWSFGATDENTTTIFDETGTYEVCLTVTNDCGEDTYCEDVYFVSQLVYETAATDIACYGEAMGSISVTPSGGEPGYSISWVGPNGFTSDQLEITGLVMGEYTMVLTDNYGYEKSESYTLDEPSEIVQDLVEITDETNNDGNGSISIDVSGGTGGLTYAWSNGATSAIVEGLSAGEYTVDVTDENGCTITFGPFEVKSTIVGVEDLAFVTGMQIYPVPAVNYLNVNIELTNKEATQLRVIDAYGKLISVKKYNSDVINAKIDVTDLAPGVYYIEFGNATDRTLEKFIVIH
ncbi:MAG: PKD domain-containing protein [Saprospiraceae bacterium]|nr:PKD domain-containing protein [Saprospiraceae bacterium]